MKFYSNSSFLILLHSERPKLHRVLAILSAIGLKWSLPVSVDFIAKYIGISVTFYLHGSYTSGFHLDFSGILLKFWWNSV